MCVVCPACKLLHYFKRRVATIANPTLFQLVIAADDLASYAPGYVDGILWRILQILLELQTVPRARRDNNITGAVGAVRANKTQLPLHMSIDRRK